MRLSHLIAAGIALMSLTAVTADSFAACYKTCTGHGIFRSCKAMCHEAFSSVPSYKTGYNPVALKTPKEEINGEYNQVVPYSYELDRAAVDTDPIIQMGNNPKRYENRVRQTTGNATMVDTKY